MGYFAERDIYCPFCGERFDCACPPDAPDSEPDYGGAFDGFTVTSDADPGL